GANQRIGPAAGGDEDLVDREEQRNAGAVRHAVKRLPGDKREGHRARLVEVEARRLVVRDGVADRVADLRDEVGPREIVAYPRLQSRQRSHVDLFVFFDAPDLRERRRGRPSPAAQESGSATTGTMGIAEGSRKAVEWAGRSPGVEGWRGSATGG